ncbi:MAG: Asp-tRNA(Asn)/Glu-tRNA(Gln) amidotransferase subunit GatB [Rubricoccaceae bacterium]
MEAHEAPPGSAPGRETGYETVVGLEIHVQLATASKLFSPDSAAFGGAPNTHVDPVSLGHPGALPVLNEAAVHCAVALGLAVGARVAPVSLFARKHYFYPDLPKGYQISQYDRPICTGGAIEAEAEDGAARRVRLVRIHLEEDAGRSLHDLDPGATLLDHNRCGVPLLEVVTEPDLRSGADAARVLAEVRRLVRYLGICDGNMEEGSLRCDANVSVRPAGAGALGAKTEVKNLNSIRAVERAVAFEAARQAAVLAAGGRVVQETRLWDAARAETRPLRSKEDAHDYRYFPDPDLPPVVVTEALRERVRAALPELPAARRARFRDTLGLPAYDAAVLTDDQALADYYEATLAALGDAGPEAAKAVSNVVMTDVLRALGETGEPVGRLAVTPARLAALVRLRLEGRLGSSAATEVFEALRTAPDAPEDIAAARGLFQVSDEAALAPVVDAVLARSPAQVAQFVAGKDALVGYFVGQVMKAFPGTPDPQRVRALLLERLGELRGRA